MTQATSLLSTVAKDFRHSKPVNVLTGGHFLPISPLCMKARSEAAGAPVESPPMHLTGSPVKAWNQKISSSGSLAGIAGKGRGSDLFK